MSSDGERVCGVDCTCCADAAERQRLWEQEWAAVREAAGVADDGTSLADTVRAIREREARLREALQRILVYTREDTTLHEARTALASAAAPTGIAVIADPSMPRDEVELRSVSHVVRAKIAPDAESRCPHCNAESTDCHCDGAAAPDERTPSADAMALLRELAMHTVCSAGPCMDADHYVELSDRAKRLVLDAPDEGPGLTADDLALCIAALESRFVSHPTLTRLRACAARAKGQK